MANLPPEVLNIIQNELENSVPQRPYLYKCLLVSKSFYAFFRTSLYQDLVIKLDENSSRRLSSLAATLDSHPLLSTQTRSLSIKVSPRFFENDANRALWDASAHSFIYGGKSYSKTAVKRLSALIHTFRTDPLKTVLQHFIDAGHLGSLSIAGIGKPLTWAMLSQKTKAALRQLRSLPSMRELSCTLVHEMEESMIWGSRSCGNLDSLSLQSVSLASNKRHTNSTQIHFLHRLSMVSCDTISILNPPKPDSSLEADPSHPPLSSYADVPRLETLHYRGRFLGRYADTHLQNILSSTAPSLRVLHIEFMSIWVRGSLSSLGHSLSLQLSAFHSLQTLKISATQDCGEEDWRVADHWVLFISTTNFPAQIPNFIISFTVLTALASYDSHPLHAASGWPALITTLRDRGLDIGKMTVQIIAVFRSGPLLDPIVLNWWKEGINIFLPLVHSLPGTRQCEVVFIPQYQFR